MKMKLSEMANALALFVTVSLIAGFAYTVYRISESIVLSIPPLAFVVAGVTILFSVAFIIASAAMFLYRWLSIKSRQIRPKNGLYPYIYDGQGNYINLNEAGVQNLAVVASLAKLTPAIAGKLLESHMPIALPAIEANALEPALNTIQPDLFSSPHTLLIGTTGSGKTSASYDILSRLAKMFHCEFLITEPGAVNWGAQAVATKTIQIADTILMVAEEMQRRQDLLGKNDVDHVSKLPTPLPFLVLVAEEMDSVLDDLKLLDREMRSRAIVALRSIARMGRKAGVCILAVSQSGTTDVFDAHVRKNMGNVLLFRSEHTVAQAWRVGEKLTDLKAGQAYSLKHESLVQFDNCNRPQLPPYNLPAKAEELPKTPATAQLQAVGEELQRLERGQQPSEQLAIQLRRLYSDGVSKTALCNQVWGYKDGTVFDLLNKALNGSACAAV